MLSYGLGREKPKHSKDIARITFDVYKQNPRDLFGSLNVKATFYGLYSMSCDFQGVGPKKVLRSETNMLHNPRVGLSLKSSSTSRTHVSHELPLMSPHTKCPTLSLPSASLTI